MKMPEIRISKDPQGVAVTGAEEFCRVASEATSAHGRFDVALSGGSTPQRLFELLASDSFRDRVEWPKVNVFWGDERLVPKDHSDSNYRMAFDALLSQVAIPESNVHRMRTELGEADKVARDYEEQIAAHFKLPGGSSPRFDLVMLGLGGDGHTASIFPGTTALHEDWRVCAPVWVEKLHAWRATLTVHTLNQAARVMFMVTGASKAHVVGEVLRGVRHTEKYPAQLIAPERGSVVWVLDESAATALMG